MARVAVAIAVGLVGLAACGGGGHSSTTTRTAAASAERTRLESQLRSTLESATSPVAAAPDLDECIVEQAGALPLATLRKLSSSNLSEQGRQLVVRCVAQGKGVSWFRGVIAGSVATHLHPPIPAAYNKCVAAGVNRLSAQQLATALNRALASDDSYSRRLGRDIGFACVHRPAVFVQFRKLWLDGIRNSLQGQHLPAAFVQCVLAKAGQIGPSRLINLLQAGSAAENAYGEKLGRECRSALSA